MLRQALTSVINLLRGFIQPAETPIFHSFRGIRAFSFFKASGSEAHLTNWYRFTRLGP